MMTKTSIINLILFQLGWFACVLGGAYDRAIAACLITCAIIGYHIYQAADARMEIRLLSVALLIGLLFESLMVNIGLATYSHGQVYPSIAPLWMILMWPLFASTLNLSMRWLKALSPWLISIIGALSAPFAYFAGNRLGAVNYDDIVLSLAAIGFAWAVLLPVVTLTASQFDGYRKGMSKRDAQEHPQHV